jgi:sulfite reductase (NADPH) flavoprotein alpha-component
MLKFTPNNVWQQIYEAIYTLHTGQGVWWLALLLGAAALAVPAMAASGIGIWYGRRRSGLRVRGNAGPRTADTVILVGTEGNSTAGFAAALHGALTEAGCTVHLAPMNSVRAYPKATQLIVVTSTYGDGHAPASASGFLNRLHKLRLAPGALFAVLGFGDHSFQHFCGYAETVEAALGDAGLEPFLPYSTVDRQSGQDFARWGRELGEAFGIPLDLAYTPPRPATRTLVLAGREDFGIEVQAPTSVLQFEAAGGGGWLGTLLGRNRLPRFEVGDLVGIVPPGSIVPRYYSLASSSRDGVLEICVRKQTGGLCSEMLHALEPGAEVQAFIRRNPDFRPGRGRRPLILIGAGAGIAPLAGFVRNNARRRPIHLFFGARDPKSDFLYGEDLVDALADGRLKTLYTAFSRLIGGGYVQDRISEEGAAVRRLIAQGAEIFVCGGLDMAQGVRTAIDELLAPTGISTSKLKAQGRYFEDAY